MPSGPAVFTGMGNSYAFFSKKFEATDGLELTIDVYPPSGVQINLRCEGQRVNWPETANMSKLVATLLGDPKPGRVNSISIPPGGVLLGVTEPGIYTFVIPPIPGYAPHAPIQVDIPRGETVELEVELTWIP